MRFVLGLFIGLLLVVALALPTAVLAEKSATATEAETSVAEAPAETAATEAETSTGEEADESDGTAIEGLMSMVEGLNLQQGIENSLGAKLQNAKDSLTAANAGLREDAVNKLQAYINACEAQRDKALTSEQADELIAHANAIVASL